METTATKRKIVKGTYTFFHDDDSEDEFNLLVSVIGKDFNEARFRKKELDVIIQKILSLQMNEQIHVIHCLLGRYYTISAPATNIVVRNAERILSKKVFEVHRNVILACVEDDGTEKANKMAEFEKQLGINIQEEVEEI